MIILIIMSLLRKAKVCNSSTLSQFLAGRPLMCPEFIYPIYVGNQTPTGADAVKIARNCLSFNGVEMDAVWKAYLKWDTLMGHSNIPDVAQLEAFTHPRAGAALELAHKAVELLPSIINDMMLSDHWIYKNSAAAWSASLGIVRESIQALGLSPVMTESLLGMAFGGKTVETFCLAFSAGSNIDFSNEKNDDSYPKNNNDYIKKVRSFLLNLSILQSKIDLGGNVFLAETSFGALGAYAHRLFFNSSGIGHNEISYRYARNSRSPVLSRACQTLSKLSDFWDMDTHVPMFPRHATAIAALCELGQETCNAEKALGLAPGTISEDLDKKSFAKLWALAEAVSVGPRVSKIARSRA